MSNLSEKLINQPSELDYVYLTSLYQNSSSPRHKIQYLLKRGDLIRVKKGIYVLGGRYTKRFSKFVLSNLIYGPSYVSCESALSYYGLIPEKVEAVTAICITKKKEFTTPLGNFIYYFSVMSDYPIGVVREYIDENRAFFIATPEKALYDLLRYRGGFKNQNDIFDTIEHLRLSEDELHKFDRAMLEKLAKHSAHKKIASSIIDYLEAKQGNFHEK